MKNQLFPYSCQNSCSGNAIVFVLIVIALIAALTMTLTRTAQQSSGSTGLQADVAAQAILRQANNVSNAIQMLIQRGCSENEIGFENATESGYANATAPADFRCHVFRAEGAGLNWPSFPNNMAVNTNAWTITGGNQVLEIGSDCAQTTCNELLMTAEILPEFEAVCDQINFRLSLPEPIVSPSSPALDSTKFSGSFGTAAPVLGNTASTAIFVGENAGCFLNTTTNNYTFYNVLIAR
jgi:hypothetical protein